MSQQHPGDRSSPFPSPDRAVYPILFSRATASSPHLSCPLHSAPVKAHLLGKKDLQRHEAFTFLTLFWGVVALEQLLLIPRRNDL